MLTARNPAELVVWVDEVDIVEGETEAWGGGDK